MELTALTVRVVLKRDTLSADDITDERHVLVGESVILEVDDDLRDELQRLVFEQAGKPASYAVTLSERRVESGGGAALGEVLIELIDHAAVGAWVVLADVVANWLRNRLRDR